MTYRRCIEQEEDVALDQPLCCHRSSSLQASLLILFFISNILAAAFVVLASLSLPAFTLPVVQSRLPSNSSSLSLSTYAIHKVLQDASPVFGHYVNGNTSTATWMNNYPDSTQLVHMNLPGAHDAQTWNYSVATQDSLEHVTNLNGITLPPASFLRCQDKSLAHMLNAGIRVFDLRFAFDATNTTLVFYHSQGLQSETATVDDVLYGYYQWLDDHPSEAVLLLLNYEGSTKEYASNDAAVQLQIFTTLTSPVAKRYFVETKNEFGTLGQARGKLTLLRRFAMDQLPASYSEALPGIYFSPDLWTDNSPDITLIYNLQKNLTAYIEDFYQTNSLVGSGAPLNIQWKYNATTAHIIKATTMYPDSLFWSFASSEYTSDTPPETPKIMAVGNGSQITPLGGVNQRLMPFLQQQKGKRVGIIMFDFFDIPTDLIGTVLSL